MLRSLLFLTLCLTVVVADKQVTKEMAAKACAKVDKDDRDFCIDDVLQTGDLEMAGAYA